MTTRPNSSSLHKWVIGAAAVVLVATALEYKLVPDTDKMLGATAMAHDANQAPASAAQSSQPTEPDPLAEQHKRLLEREADLQTREASLQDREAQVAQMLQELGAKRTAAEALRKVAGMYASMPPPKAASMLRGLEREMAVEILHLLDHEQAAAILAIMDPALGAELTSLLLQPQSN